MNTSSHFVNKYYNKNVFQQRIFFIAKNMYSWQIAYDDKYDTWNFNISLNWNIKYVVGCRS